MNFLREFINDAIVLFKSDSISNSIDEIKTNIISDSVNLLPMVYSQTLLSIIKTVTDIPSMIFWSKMERFLRGLNVLSFEERIKFYNKLSNDDFSVFMKRIVLMINEIDDEGKVIIFVNLTRALMLEQLELDRYFRLIHCVKNTLLEDLKYLNENVRMQELGMNINTISLSQSGLAYQSLIDGIGSTKFKVSDLGVEVVLYGIKYDKFDENKDLLILKNNKVNGVIVRGLELSNSKLSQLEDNFNNTPKIHSIPKNGYVTNAKNGDFIFEYN